jgi:signal recognition particle receptor subunit beta
MMKIAVFGPPLSGKATFLRELAFRQRAAISARDANGSKTSPILYCVECEIHHVRFEIVTIPGYPWSPDDWSPLLEAAHALIVVLDLQPDREVESSAARERVELYVGTRPHVAVLTKSDLRGGASTAKPLDVGEAVKRYRLDGWKVYQSNHGEMASTIVREVAAQLLS